MIGTTWLAVLATLTPTPQPTTTEPIGGVTCRADSNRLAPCHGTIGPARIVIDATEKSYRAIDSETGRLLWRRRDAGALLDLVLRQVVRRGGGEIVLAPGVYQYRHVVPELPTAASQWIRLRGHGATIQLGPDARAAFQWGHQVGAKQNVTRQIWLEGFAVDAAGTEGWNEAALVRTPASLDDFADHDWEQIVIREIHLFNLPSTVRPEINHRGALQFNTITRSGTARVTFKRQIVVEAVQVDGGSWGILFDDACRDGRQPSGRTSEVWLVRNRVALNRPVARHGVPGTCYHLGEQSLVESAFLIGNDCAFSGDNGIEVDNAQFVVLQGNRLVNVAGPGIFVTTTSDNAAHGAVITIENTTCQQDADKQIDVPMRCVQVAVPVTPHEPPMIDLLRISGLEMSSSRVDLGATAVELRGSIARIVVEELRFRGRYAFGAAHASREPFLIGPISIVGAPADAPRNVTIRGAAIEWDLEILPRMARNVLVETIFLSGGKLAVELDQIRIDYTLRGDWSGPRGVIEALALGRAPDPPTRLSGTIQDVVVRSGGPGQDDAPYCLRFGSPRSLSFAEPLVLRSIDCSGLPDSEQLVGSDGVDLRGQLHSQGNRPETRFEWR